MALSGHGAGRARVVPLEVKSSETAAPAMARTIRRLAADLGDEATPGYVVYFGDRRLPLGEGVTALPLGQL